jgi:hypothetical protein
MLRLNRTAPYAALLAFLVSGLISGADAQEHPAAAASADAAAATSPDTNMEILRDKMRADKKAIVAENMDLTESEAAAFWPIYDEYQADQAKINERMLGLIKDYANAYNAGNIQDDQAKGFISEALDIRQDQAQMQRKYADKLQKSLPAAKAARYLQIENKIRAVVDYDLATNIPLVE